MVEYDVSLSDKIHFYKYILNQSCTFTVKLHSWIQKKGFIDLLECVNWTLSHFTIWCLSKMWRFERPTISPLHFAAAGRKSINLTVQWDGGRRIFQHERRVISLLMSGGSTKPSFRRTRIRRINQPIALPAFIGNTWAEWSIDRRSVVIVVWDKYLQT